jgi:phosphatidate cytidylyltransferase
VNDALAMSVPNLREMRLKPAEVHTERTRAFNRNLAARIASATILIPAVLATIWYGGGPFLLMIAIAVGLMGVEWAKMSAPDAPAEVAVTITVAVLCAVFAAYTDRYPLAWVLTAAGALVAGIASRHKTERAADAGYGVIYIAPAIITMIWLRSTAQEMFHWDPALGMRSLIPGPGVSWTLMLFAVTWAADIGAYAFGSVLKGPKLWPRISPNKTWSGFAGGLICAALAGLGMTVALAAIELSWHVALFIGFVGGLATMAGDLWESILKRRFGVKDSGDLIPGHGGLMDRVDGLMFAAIAVAACRFAVNQGWMI